MTADRTSASFQRAAALYDQGRYDLAEPAFRQHLGGAPDDPLAHALLSLSLANLDRPADAQAEAEAAIAAAPDLPLAHHSLSVALRGRGRPKEALAAADEAIRLDPEDPDGHLFRAAALYDLRRWAKVVAATDVGLALDPQHEGLQTVRSQALTQQGRRREAAEAVAGTLARNPENPYAHVARSYNLLNAGRYEEAMEGYREALRLDPGNDAARAGLVEAMKARNPIYGFMLRWLLLTSRLSGRGLILLYVGFFFVNRAIRTLARDPATQGLGFTLLAGYLLFAWLTFAAVPLFNLVLRLDPVGRHALTAQDRELSNIVGPLVAVGLVAAVVAIVLTAAPAAFLAVVCLGVVIPVASAYAAERRWVRMLFWGIAVLVVAFGGAAVALGLRNAPGDGRLAEVLVILVIVAISITTWIAPLARLARKR